VRNRVLLSLGVVAVTFLAGFLPQYLKSVRLRQELAQATLQNQEAGLRDLAALAYLQAAQKNFGLASASTTRFFNDIQKFAASAQDTASQPDLRAIYAYRDKITAELARGDAAAIDDLQQVFMKTRAATMP
jgi:hypothetical protein